MKPVRVEKVEPLEKFRGRITFTDGSVRDIDLTKYLRGPIFQAVRDDPGFFKTMRVGGGTISWPNGADIDPDVLFRDLTPAWMDSEALDTPESR